MEKIKRGKKGVSALIATVLLVLITVAGIGIIWNFVSPMLKPDVSSLACMDADLTINTDDVYTYWNVSNHNLTLQIFAGNKVKDLKDILISVSTVSNGKPKTIVKSVANSGNVTPTNLLNADESEVYIVQLAPEDGNVTSAKVAAFLIGAKDSCAMSAPKEIPAASDLY